MMTLLAQVPPPPPPPPPAPLLATTGTELLEFAILIAAGVLLSRRSGLDAAGFFKRAFFSVCAFFLLWPQDSGPQREADVVVMHLMASLVSGLMNLGGLASTVEGISVIAPMRYTMARGCMGLSYLSMAMLCMLAYPVAWRRRFIGALGIAAGMVWLNALRILLLYHLWWQGLYETHAWVHRLGGVFFAAFALAMFWAANRPAPAVAPRRESAPLPQAGTAVAQLP
jgi:exosortase/archaeosortase family protein